MVIQKSRFNFFFWLICLLIVWIFCLSVLQTFCLSVSNSVIYMYSQAATQNLFITHFNLSINQFEVGQSDIKSGSHSVSHFMFSHCQSVSYFIFSICQSVSQSVILCSVTVSQSVSHFMFSYCQSVSELFYVQSLSVSQWVIYVPHHLSVSQSASHLCSSSSVCLSVSQWVIYVPHLWVSESFYVQYLSVSRLVILCSVSVCQSLSQSFYVQYLSVSQSFYVQYLLVSQSDS